MTPREECELLMNELLPVATVMLRKNLEFYPFGCVMNADGTLRPIACYEGNDRPRPSDMVAELKKSYHALARRKEIKASGIVWNTVYREADGTELEAVMVSLEHRDAYSVRMVSPYRKRLFKRIEWDPVISSEGEKDIFRSA